jgi:hypothetical protein
MNKETDPTSELVSNNEVLPEKKNYPFFKAGNSPNRHQRRIDAGVNKRTLHKPKQGRKMLLIIDNIKWRHFIQKIPVKNKAGEIIGYNVVKHTN